MDKFPISASGVAFSARRHTTISWMLLVSGIALSAALAVATQRQVEQEARHRFEAASQDVLHRVQAEIGSYEEVLVGLRGFLGSKEHVTRAEFRRYVEGLDLPRRFPGFENLNYAQVVGQKDIRRFEEDVRSDRSVHPAGYPRFSVHPEGQRPEYYVIVYIEPWERSAASFGRDLYMTNPAVVRALARQRDTGEIVTSGALIRIDGANRHIGLAMRLAVYRPGTKLDSLEARRAAFRGSVGAGYRIADVMRVVARDDRLSQLRFRLIDLGENGNATAPEKDRILFDSSELYASALDESEFTDGPGQFTYRQSFPNAGRIWEIQFVAPKHAAGLIAPHLPWLVLGTSMLLTTLLFGLFRSLASSRLRAEALARAITEDLRDSEASLAEAQRIAGLGNWSVDYVSGEMRWSAEALRLLGVSEATAAPDLDAYLRSVHTDDREQVRAAFTACAQEGTPADIEHRIAVADSFRWVHVLAEARRHADGSVQMLRGTIMDISERKLEARRKELETAVAQLFAHGRSTAETMQDVVAALCDACGYRSGRYLGPEDAAPPALGASIRLPLIAEERDLGAIELAEASQPEDAQHTLLLEGLSGQIAQYLLRRHAEDNFKYLATHHALTGLPNRLLFGQRLSIAIARAERAKQGLGVLIVDLDRFKNVNDTLGHGAGDAVLKACAERLSRALRDSDVVAHIAGDEFAILIEPCLQPSAATAVARKVLNAIERPLIVQGQEIVLTGSVGISIYHEDGRDAETLLKHADIAMFRAKENGRNSYQFYSPQMNPHGLQRLGLEAALRRALERKEFLLHYQPKVDAQSGRVTGVEALVRWNHSERGMVSPAEFIPIAEETGLIEPIGAWVLDQACAQAARWSAEGLDVRVAVNLSARQFRDRRLASQIQRCLAQHALDPRLLELELTESMVMQDPVEVAEMMRELKRMGLSLSIDDFGTGYSSLAYLKRFPIDNLKIDRSFVKDIPGDPEDVAIVEAVVALARSMRLRVVAEGVETQAQLKHLGEVGCDEIQGYLVSKPLPMEQATRFLKDRCAAKPAQRLSIVS